MKIPLISSLFKSKARDSGWLAVGLLPSGICFAQVDFTGTRLKVVRCEYLETGTVSVADLERLRREFELDNAVCTTLLSPGDYQIFIVDAPNVPADELKTAIRWKIKDSLLYPIDSAVVDVLKIPPNKNRPERAQSLYAIAANNEIIQRRAALFEQAKLQLGVIDIPDAALRNIAALYEQEDRALVLMVFDDYGGMLTFTSGGELYLSRRIDITIGQLCDADEDQRSHNRDRVELELQRSLDYFDRQFNHLTISRLLLSAPDEVDLLELLATTIGVTVEKLDLAQVMDISAIPALENERFVAHVLPTLGAALRKELRVL